MAEETSDDISIEGEGKEKILGLPKKTFFIAVAALTVILLAVAGYLFFAAGDKPTGTIDPIANTQQNQNGAEQGSSVFFPSGDSTANGQNAPSANQPQAPTPQANQTMPANSNQMMEHIFDLREQAIQLKEENLLLKKRIYDLETGNGTNNANTTSQQSTNPSDNQPYKNPYDKEIKDFPPIEPYVPVDKPKPKWG